MQPILYIISRNDLKWSLNAGKQAAQVSHASAQFVSKFDDSWDPFKIWSREGDGFGTTIVLEANIDQINEIHKTWNTDSISLKGIITDPTYPLFIPKELLDYSKQIKKNLNIVDIGETNEKGLTFVTMKQVTCSWLFFHEEDRIEAFKEYCKEKNIGLAR